MIGTDIDDSLLTDDRSLIFWWFVCFRTKVWTTKRFYKQTEWLAWHGLSSVITLYVPHVNVWFPSLFFWIETRTCKNSQRRRLLLLDLGKVILTNVQFSRLNNIGFSANFNVRVMSAIWIPRTLRPANITAYTVITWKATTKYLQKMMHLVHNK